MPCPYDASYTRPGFLPVGWNTEPDGTGLSIGFGSRFDHRAESQMDLCLQWVPCNGESDFTYFLENGEAILTGYSGTAAPVIPETLGGCPVTSIAAGAFGDLTGDLILPPSLKTIAPGSFGVCELDSLTFFDTLEQFPEEAFAGLFRENAFHSGRHGPPVFRHLFRHISRQKWTILPAFPGKRS